MDIHFTKKDFKLEWFSGTGAGGQHRNKHQNCCRITHIESGLSSTASSKERIANQRRAFHNLAMKLIKHYDRDERPEVVSDIIRNYNESRNEVHDKSSGLKMPYTEIVGKNNIEPMIEARRLKGITSQ